MRFNTFSIVSGVLETASAQFLPDYTRNDENIAILKTYCEAIDKIIEDEDDGSIECSVNEYTKEVEIAIELISLSVNYPKTDIFQQLIKRSYPVVFQNKDGEFLRVQFTFPSVWERVN